MLDFHRGFWGDLKQVEAQYGAAADIVIGELTGALELLEVTGDPLDEQPGEPPIRAFSRYFYPSSAVWVAFATRSRRRSPPMFVLHVVRADGLPATRRYPPKPPDSFWAIALSRLQNPEY